MSKIFLNILLACSWVLLCSAIANNYQWGSVASTDSLMASEMVTKVGFLGMVTTYEYTYSQLGVTTPLTISSIKITDKKKFKGATAVVSSGGVGSTEVTITFTSLRGAGIKSLVEIYGAAA